MTVLALLVPPDRGGVIASAMAIQAHQPEKIVLLSVTLGTTITEYNGLALLQAWIRGGEELVNQYPNLDEPFPFPFSIPSGFQNPNASTNNSKQINTMLNKIVRFIKRILGVGVNENNNVIQCTCSQNDIIETLREIERKVGDDDLRFDLLPGAKFLKLPLMVESDIGNWGMYYTLQDGGIYSFDQNIGGYQKGHHLSIIDRCWLAGHPVFVEQHEEQRPEDSEMEFYDQILRCLRTEPMGDDEKERLLSLRKKPGPKEMKRREKDRPIGFRGIGVDEKLSQVGFKVERSNTDITISKDGIEWYIELFNENGTASGLPFEKLVQNQLWRGWNPIELVLGLNIIEGTPEDREKRYTNHIRNMRQEYEQNIKNPDKRLGDRAVRYANLCERLQLPTDCPQEELVEAEMDYLRSSHNTNQLERDDYLKYICHCEIDLLLLDSNGITSFDSKTVIWGDINTKQGAMQCPDFLRPTQFLVISSSEPNEIMKYRNVLHLHRLDRGRELLTESERYMPLWK